MLQRWIYKRCEPRRMTYNIFSAVNPQMSGKISGAYCIAIMNKCNSRSICSALSKLRYISLIAVIGVIYLKII
jgi:hypothetical protein